MKIEGYIPLLQSGERIGTLITAKPVPGIPQEEHLQLVLRTEAEAEIAAAMQNLRAYREDSEAEIARLKGLLELSNTDLTLMHKRHDEMLEELQQARNSAKAWEESAGMFYRGQNYYCTIVRKVGALFGTEVYTSDDGSVQDEVLAEKVYDLALVNYGKRPHGSNRFVRAWNALLGR